MLASVQVPQREGASVGRGASGKLFRERCYGALRQLGMLEQ